MGLSHVTINVSLFCSVTSKLRICVGAPFDVTAVHTVPKKRSAELEFEFTPLIHTLWCFPGCSPVIVRGLEVFGNVPDVTRVSLSPVVARYEYEVACSESGLKL